MKTPDIDSLKSAWKKEKGFDNPKLSESDIEKFLKRKSRDITQLFKKGLIIDLVLKGLTGISLIGIIILFTGNSNILISMLLVLALILWSIWFQVKMYRNIPSDVSSEPVIRNSLEKRIQFYHENYVKSLYIGALSNALIFVSGSLYYFYFKYGEIRPLDLTDFLVFGGATLIAFIFGAAVNIGQMNFQVKQLESCLQEIDEDSISELTLKEQKNKRRRLFFIMLLALISGLLLLAYLIS
jgi:hypothetical protein